MKIKFWGVRGSIPTPGPSTARVGGNTSCVEVRAGGQLLIFDLGTGARALGGALMAAQPVRAHVFLSHLHHDHTQGLPFFAPCFVPSSELTFYTARKSGEPVQAELEAAFDFPYFPVPLKGMASRRTYVALQEGRPVELPGGVTVQHAALNHPDGSTGFRVECEEGGRRSVFAYCTDTEHGTEADASVRRLARGADALVYDAQYTDEEYPTRKGWGHSTVAEAAKAAADAGAKALFLFHHDPSHNDDKILAMEAEAKAAFPGARAAVEGLELEF